MRRRNFLATLGLVIAAPWSAPAARLPRIGFLSGGDEKGADGFVTAMRGGLQAEGYTEPGTMTLDRVYADYALDKVPALVEELQRRGADLIVTHAAATPVVVQDKDRLVPAVYEFSADPIEVGIATDLAHPLFNATGVTLMKAELNGKLLEFLYEFAPSVRRVAGLLTRCIRARPANGLISRPKRKNSVSGSISSRRRTEPNSTMRWLPSKRTRQMRLWRSRKGSSSKTASSSSALQTA